MRQKGDPLFKEILDRLRFGGCSVVDLKILEQLKDTEFPEGIKPTKLYSKNVSVDAINTKELLNLKTEVREFVTDIKGDFAKRWATTNRVPEKVRESSAPHHLVSKLTDIHAGPRVCRCSGALHSKLS
jgi:hypothetical protein